MLKLFKILKEEHGSMTQLDMIFPIANDSSLHQSPNTVGVMYLTQCLKWDYNSPNMTKYYNDYIMDLYVTVTSRDIYGQKRDLNKTKIVIRNYHTPYWICTFNNICVFSSRIHDIYRS